MKYFDEKLGGHCRYSLTVRHVFISCQITDKTFEFCLEFDRSETGFVDIGSSFYSEDKLNFDWLRLPVFSSHFGLCQKKGIPETEKSLKIRVNVGLYSRFFRPLIHCTRRFEG